MCVRVCACVNVCVRVPYFFWGGGEGFWRGTGGKDGGGERWEKEGVEVVVSVDWAQGEGGVKSLLTVTLMRVRFLPAPILHETRNETRLLCPERCNA